jgi:hypothetical protein
LPILGFSSSQDIVDEPANLPVVVVVGVVVVVVIDDVVDVAIVVLSSKILKLIVNVITTISITIVIVATVINIFLWFLDILLGDSFTFLGSDFALVLCFL